MFCLALIQSCAKAFIAEEEKTCFDIIEDNIADDDHSTILEIGTSNFVHLLDSYFKNVADFNENVNSLSHKVN